MNDLRGAEAIHGPSGGAAESFRTIAESLLDAIAVLNDSACCVYINQAHRRLFGNDVDPDPLGQMYLGSRVHPEDLPLLRESVSVALNDGTGNRCEFRIHRPDGAVCYVESQTSAVPDSQGHIRQVIIVSRDITEKRLAEQALHSRDLQRVRRSEERFGVMVENVREYGMYTLDLEGCITSWNLGAERITGYSVQEIAHRHFSRFFLAEDIERGEPSRQLDLARSRGRHECEGWRVRKSGARFWAHVIVTPLFDGAGNASGYSKITHDISERRRAAEDLRSYAERLRVTSRRLVEIQEAERRTMASELHDRVGQNLTALGLNLSLIGGWLPGNSPPELTARIEESGALVRKTVDAIRNVMGELRPQVLDDYGLPAALRLLASGFSRRTGTEVSVAADGNPDSAPEAVHLAMYRIVQEALNNVAKHSAAKHVDIRLAKTPELLTLSILDDGIGFESAHTGGHTKGWGLMIMRERAEAVGAQFRLETRPSRGVSIHVEYRI